MKTIGITGQNGFVGYHLYQTLKLYKKEFEVIDYHRDFFNNEDALDDFVSSCDVIVHLAALNRHNDPELIYQTNTGLVQKLIDSLHRVNKKVHILISSSTQEERDNLYGKSKKEGREMFSKWSSKTQSPFSGLVIPNVYGPFGHPNYNSVVATFCHKVSRDEKPEIHVDGTLNLIYVGELVAHFIKAIREEDNSHNLPIPHTHTIKVSEILAKLEYYRTLYQDNGEYPQLNNTFEKHLFNTFRCYMDIESYFPRKLTPHKDNRGSFVEIARCNIPGQTSFSTTVPGITRGNHYHTRKIERFAVIKGKALIQLRKIGTEEVFDFYLDGDEPSYVDMPIWYTHNIKNIGDEVLYTIFWIDEPFSQEDPDTWFEEV